MAFELGPDGKPVEVATSFRDKDKTKPPGNQPAEEAPTTPPTAPPAGNWQQGAAADAPTKPGGSHNMFAHVDQQDMRPKGMNATAEPPTKPKGAAPAGTPTPPPAMEQPKNVPPAEPKTRIYQPTAPAQNINQELVCGWLVVVDGPGKGASLVVGPGQSFVSRSSKERICLDFGDDTVTSGQQFRIIYDDEGREFVIGPGEGANPTRLNGKILAAAMPLVTGDLVKAGQTTMRFVAFCGDDFNWD